MFDARKVVIALVASAAFVGPALAADGGPEDGVAWLLNPGPSFKITVTDPTASNFVSQRSRTLRSFRAEDPRGSAYSQWRDMMIRGQ